jgi:hypothetical protein
MSYKDARAKQTQDYCDIDHFNVPIYYGYVDSRSWFQAGFFGLENASPDAATPLGPTAIPAGRRRRRGAGSRHRHRTSHS